MAIPFVGITRPREVPVVVSGPAQPAPSQSSRFRIEYIDGIRGLAAFAIVIMHAFEIFGHGGHPVGVFSDGLLDGNLFDRIFEFVYTHGVQRFNYAVEIFIVLSGYSLMLGVARSKDGQPKGGMSGYFKRRIRRIWPPYYSALVVSLLIIALVPGMNQKHNLWWDLAVPVTAQDILTHMTFTHTVFPHTYFGINPPMWTIAVEEQIYILFPILLLPAYRQWGIRGMVGIGLFAGFALYLTFTPYLANMWYIGLFSLGAAAASIGFSSRANEQSWRARIPWGKVSLALFLLFWVIMEITSRRDLGLGDPQSWLDTILGAAVATGLIYFTETWKRGQIPPLSPLRLFSHPAITALGRFSYSLYLMHAPILAILALWVYQAGLRSWQAYGIIFLVGVPLAVSGTYLFHRIFERPFMPNSAKSQPEVARQVVAP